MTNMKPPQEGRNTGAPSLRGLQGRSATGLNGQAAKEEVSALWQGGWMPENISGVPTGRSVFHLTSPLIGLLNTCGGYWTHRQSLSLRRFLRFLSTEAPSLHRHYPVSSVLRASPSPQTARPGSRELPVDPDCDLRWGFPCCLWSPMSACRRHYPGRSDGTDSLSAAPPTSAFPTLQLGRLPH